MPDRIDLYTSDLYINRELSWLMFNRHVLEEVRDTSVPLLDRIKFLAICYGNQDEFFMVRVPSMIQADDRKQTIPDQKKIDPLFDEIFTDVASLMRSYRREWTKIKRELADNGILIKKYRELSEEQKEWVSEYFGKEISKYITSTKLDLSQPFPFVSNDSLNLVVRTKHSYSVVNVPVGRFPRFMKLPSDRIEYVMLEDIVKNSVQMMFDDKVIGAYVFRITRNGEITVRVDGNDLLTAVESALEDRDKGYTVRVMAESCTPRAILELFVKEMRFGSKQIHLFREELPLSDLWELAGLNIPGLKEKKLDPPMPEELSSDHDIFDSIKKKDHLVFHPYEPFSTIIRFMEQAAVDKDVISMNIALYRMGKDPAVANALKEAKRNGKSVNVLMEVRAKFDEESNMKWSEDLSAAGVNVIFGPPDLKVHSKILQVTRIENGVPIRYTHMSSGNYNASTAKQYSDMSFLTSDKDIGDDVALLFETLSQGFSEKEYKKLLVAPYNIKKGIIERIERETEHAKNGKDGYIAIKVNGVIDPDVIAALYKASIAGVKIDLNIRGTCCLRPGVKGVSENIRVISIVDRFLEHSRIFYFLNGGDTEMFMGSSDLMPRNLSMRVETLFPVTDEQLRDSVKENILDIHLSDTVKARELTSEGKYSKLKGKGKFRSQEWFIENRGKWNV